MHKCKYIKYLQGVSPTENVYYTKKKGVLPAPKQNARLKSLAFCLVAERGLEPPTSGL